MASRRSHRKSRYGCAQCKQRRVKCDEGTPSCQNCVRRREKCSLAKFARPSAVQDAAGTPIRSDGGTAAAQHSAQPLDFNPHVCNAARLNELHLMNHYSTTTCETMGSTPQQVEVWRRDVPREATRHGFLMDGILSIAALHRAHLDPSRGHAHTADALKYQNSGLQGYRAALGRIDDDNYQAVFAFSVLLTVMGFAKPAAYPETRPASPAGGVDCVLGLLKGVQLTTEAYAEALHGGMFKPIFQKVEGRPPGPDTAPIGDARPAMARLRQRADFMGKYVGARVRQVYLSGIDSLEAAFDEVGGPQGFGIIIAWPVMVSPQLVDLFRQGDPMALLLWVHYGVLTLSLHGQWWGRGFGVRLVEDLSATLHELHPEWTEWTEWARKCASLVS